MAPRREWIALALIGTALAGCGPDVKPVPLIRVRGVVTFDGEPLEKAVVVFESADGSFSYAETDSRGRYDLRFDSQTRGVTLGPKTVRINMNRRVAGLNSTDEGGPDDRAGSSFRDPSPELIPARYNSRSTLAVEVTEDADTFDFDLRSDLGRASAPNLGAAGAPRIAHGSGSVLRCVGHQPSGRLAPQVCGNAVASFGVHSSRTVASAGVGEWVRRSVLNGTEIRDDRNTRVSHRLSWRKYAMLIAALAVLPCLLTFTEAQEVDLTGDAWQAIARTKTVVA